MKLNRINSRKLKHGSVSVTLTVLIVVAAIMLNVAVTMLANNYNWMYIDMTAEQLFTLSDDCVELLDRSFIKIMNNRESLNKELPKTNHGIAVDNVAAAEKNVELAKNAITVALSNIEAAKENHVYFEQSVIKARSNLNIAESNLEFAELILEHAEETGDAEEVHLLLGFFIRGREVFLLPLHPPLLFQTIYGAHGQPPHKTIWA